MPTRLPQKSSRPEVPRLRGLEGLIWEFLKIGATLFWGRYNKDPTI